MGFGVEGVAELEAAADGSVVVAAGIVFGEAEAEVGDEVPSGGEGVVENQSEGGLDGGSGEAGASRGDLE